MTDTMKRLIAMLMAYEVEFEYNDTDKGKYLLGVGENKYGRAILWEYDDPRPHYIDEGYRFFPYEGRGCLHNPTMEQMMAIILRKKRLNKK